MQSQQLPEAANGRGALTVGFVLILLGGSALATQAFPEYNRYVPLIIGLGLLAVFFYSRAYIALVFGGIMTGLGTGLIVADLLPGIKDDGPGSVLGLGFGFIGIWFVSWLMRLKESHFWPLIPGAILVMVGTGLVFDTFEQDVSRWIVPAIVVAIGVLIMAAGYLRGSRGSHQAA